MSIGEPKMPTPEEMAKIQKERALSDAELIKGGAEYVADETGNSRLEVTGKQKSEINRSHYEEMKWDDLSEGEQHIAGLYSAMRDIKKIVSSSKVDHSTQMEIEDKLEYMEKVCLDDIAKELKETKSRGFSDIRRIVYRDERSES